MNFFQQMQMVNQIRQNPAQFLMQRGFNIPSNIKGPQDIVKYLVDSGQVSQEQYQNAVNQLQNFKL